MHRSRQAQPSRALRQHIVVAALIGFVVASAAGPSTAATTAGAASAASAPAGRASAPKKKAAPVKLVDINSASRKELKTIPGIGDAEADKIVANRPYLSKAELVSKNVLPIGPYTSIKNRIVVLNPPKPKATN